MAVVDMRETAWICAVHLYSRTIGIAALGMEICNGWPGVIQNSEGAILCGSAATAVCYGDRNAIVPAVFSVPVVNEELVYDVPLTVVR